LHGSSHYLITAACFREILIALGVGLVTTGNFHIRAAVPDDVPLILRFIKGLAEFERLSHAVTVTEEGLRESLFGANPAAEVVLGFQGENPAGFAVFFHNYSTFLGRRGMYLEDIFVSPEYRSRGLGRLLLTHVAGIAAEQGCGRFEWAVLDWNENAARFSQKLGMEMLDDWRIFRMNSEALRKLASKNTGGG